MSISVLLSAVIYLIFGVNIEAYVGAVVSVFIIKTGLDLIIESVNSVLGVRVESKLAKSIKRVIAAKELDVSD